MLIYCCVHVNTTRKKYILEKVTELSVFCVSNQNDNDDDGKPTAALYYYCYYIGQCADSKPVFIHMIKSNAHTHTCAHNNNS